MTNLFGKLQRVGKAFMLPVSVLPVAALFLRFGAPDILDIPFLFALGDAIFGNLALIFAIGLAVGLAKENHGAAGLSGAVSLLVLNAGVATINPDVNMNVMAGIIAGIVAGVCYNKFHKTKLPSWLGFFGGKRFVPIVSASVNALLAVPFGFLWIYVQNAIDALSRGLTGAGAFGTFGYGFINRLLIPTGLHHVTNNIIFHVFGEFNGATGDYNRFLAGDPTAGTFMAGFYVIMMFALPAAAFAMYRTAKPSNRKAVGGALFSVAFTAFLTGITEPIEFMFMFLAPVLYVFHAIMTGLAMAVCTLLNCLHGFAFSAGATDYLLSYGLSTNGWLIVPIGALFAVVYYFVFKYAIIKFNLPTPGRMDEDGTGAADEIIKERGIGGLAAEYIQALGGSANILEIDACITRLRLSLKDASIVSDDVLKGLGASGVIRPTKNTMQVVVGTHAEIIVDEMKDIM